MQVYGCGVFGFEAHQIKPNAKVKKAVPNWANILAGFAGVMRVVRVAVFRSNKNPRVTLGKAGAKKMGVSSIYLLTEILWFTMPSGVLICNKYIPAA